MAKVSQEAAYARLPILLCDYCCMLVTVTISLTKLSSDLSRAGL